MGTATELRRDIGCTISEAMAKLSDIDWRRESPAITAAQAEMEEQMALYSENKASKQEVKAAYVQFRDAHKGGLFG